MDGGGESIVFVVCYMMIGMRYVKNCEKINEGINLRFDV